MVQLKDKQDRLFTISGKGLFYVDPFAKHVIYFASTGLALVLAILAMLGKVPGYVSSIAVAAIFVCRIVFWRD